MNMAKKPRLEFVIWVQPLVKMSDLAWPGEGVVGCQWNNATYFLNDLIISWEGGTQRKGCGPDSWRFIWQSIVQSPRMRIEITFRLMCVVWDTS